MTTAAEVGAAVLASASMGWNGTIKDLTPKPVNSSASARIMVGFMSLEARAEI